MKGTISRAQGVLRRKLANGSLYLAGTVTGESLRLAYRGLTDSVFHLSQQDLQRIREADVISFDIFDTLVVRDVTDPKMIFDLCGLALNMQGFRSLRAGAERELRAGKSTEVTLKEIYELLSARCGIDPEEAMRLEIDLERKHCHADPRMKQVFDRVRAMCVRENKKCVIVSDMYLPQSVVENILESCGYAGYDRLFLSSACGWQKSSGTLYRYMKECLGPEKKYLHIGDNEESDIKNAGQYGIRTIRYPRLSIRGLTPQKLLVNPFPGDFYCSLVNRKMLSQTQKLPDAYCFGYTYFGLLVYGYCQWLHACREKYKADVIYFAARDMKAVQPVYQLLFPDEKTEYVNASRLAMLRANLPKMSEMFLRNLDEAFSSGAAPRTVLEKTALSRITEYLELKGIDPDETGENNRRRILKTLREDPDGLAALFAGEKEAAKAYFTGLAFGRRILFADLNGRATGAIAVQDILTSAGKMCEVICTQMYTTTQGELADSRAGSKRILTWLFSMDHDRFHRTAFSYHWDRNARILEAVFTEERGTLLSYGDGIRAEGAVYADYTGDSKRLSLIHRGIRDFAQDFHKVWSGTGLTDEIDPQLGCTVLAAALDADIKKEQIRLTMGG